MTWDEWMKSPEVEAQFKLMRQEALKQAAELAARPEPAPIAPRPKRQKDPNQETLPP